MENNKIFDFNQLESPVLLRGDASTAYRDPAVIRYNGLFHLYCTMVKTEADGKVYLYTIMTTSRDLRVFSRPEILTAKDQNLNFSSPGNIIRHHNKWIMCLQSYPRPNGEKYANETARLWTMESDDLINWSEPELMMVKGNDMPVNEMGRMIDPYLLEDKDESGKYWCFYKQNGVSMSWSSDLKNWTWSGYANAGENVCVLTINDEYTMFHSPANGIGVMHSRDMKNWSESDEVITLGQRDWPWALGRLTAGFVLDCRKSRDIGKYLMFFHGSGPEDETVIFDTHASIGIAWSDDLKNWDWPGKDRPQCK